MDSFPGPDPDLRRGSRSFNGEDGFDEEALRWVALQRLPTYDRARKAFLRTRRRAENGASEEGEEEGEEEEEERVVDVEKLGFLEKQRFIDKILRVVEEDNEEFLRKLRSRIDRVGIEVPTIEVRFEHLNVAANARSRSRALPTLFNFMTDLIEGAFSFILPTKTSAVNILRDVSGVIKPSRMTLLLGPPGSGKSTFLLALAGKLSPNVKVSGKVTYNGYEMHEFIPQRTSAYISQYDTQLSTLTVRETLDFSSRCQGVGSRYEMLVELLKREKEAGIKPDPDADIFMKAIAVEGQQTNIVTDYVLKMLGLDICADILIGDQMIRGISGGQRKRVTTGEMLVGPAKAFFMDEISTGLDSSTTFQILNCLSHFVHVMDVTMVVSLLQPPPETFELFDDVILLAENGIVYQGPRATILDFFESRGFRCPERKSVADFLQEITSKKDQEQYWVDKTQPYQYITPEEFSESFKSSDTGKALKEELSIPFDKSKCHAAALSTRKYGINKKDLFKACFSREWLLMKRNSFLYVFKTCQLFVVAIVAMTVFFRTQLHQKSIADGTLYMGALFFGLVIVMFNGFAELVNVVSRLPVYYKQRDQLFYPAWAYSVPSIVLGIPFSLLGSCLWVCLTYYVIGFTPEPGRFFRQLLLLFCVSQMALSLFRLLGSVGRSALIASSFGTFALMIVFVMGGFIISGDQIPDWWIWAYWMSPMMYAQNSLVINEFLADRWKTPYNGSINAHTIGTAVLKLRGFHDKEYWYWIGVSALVGFAILFNVLFTMALAYLSPLNISQSITSQETNKRGSLREELSSHSQVNKNLGKVGPSSISSGGIDTENGPKRGMVLPFHPLSMSFKSVSYYVDMPPEMKKQRITDSDRLQLLQEVTGAFRPGVLTALMGVSGAGKTTLMDVLAGRKTGGYIEGDIRISGYPKKQETFARISGYCEQNDIHSPNVTVKESLAYSAWLRLPKDVDNRTRTMFVEEIMELIELNPIKDALVGLPGVNGLSTEQRKRLTIAVELVANPSILFMDEPTSGLDARAAAIVMRTVRNTVNTGRTVVCTIHQPSIDIFEAFDELLLLKQGGQVIYSGPVGHHSSKLIEYFQSIPGVPQIKEGYNPAAWMLDVSSSSAEARCGIDFAQFYKNSPLYTSTEELVEQLSTPPANSKDLFFTTKYSQSFWEQCMACFWKQHWSYWQNPYYNAVRLMFTVAIALLFGSTFWGLGRKRGTVQDISNLMGALYAATLFLGFSNSTTVQPVVGIERTVFYRERGAGMYSALAYAFAQAAIEVPYVFAQTLLYVPILYAMISFDWTAPKFFYFFFFTFFILLCFTYYGMMSVAITPSLNFSTIISSAFFSFWNLFSGFMIPRLDIPVWWRWYYWANPISWSLYGLIGSQLADDNTLLINPDLIGKQQTVKQFVEQNFGYHYSFLWAVAVVHVGMPLLFIFVFAYGVKRFNFQKR